MTYHLTAETVQLLATNSWNTIIVDVPSNDFLQPCSNFWDGTVHASP